MKTLYDRLRSDVKEKMSWDKFKYPTLIDNIRIELTTTNSFTDIKVGTANYLHGYHVDDMRTFDLLTYMNLFSEQY